MVSITCLESSLLSFDWLGGDDAGGEIESREMLNPVPRLHVVLAFDDATHVTVKRDRGNKHLLPVNHHAQTLWLNNSPWKQPRLDRGTTSMDLPPKSPASTRSPSVASHATNRTDPHDNISNTMKRMSLSNDRRASAAALPSPTSPKAPPTPTSARRPSSSFALRQSTSSPRLTKRASRSSLSGASPQQSRDADDKRPTPKKSISNLISGLREAQAQASMAPIVEPVYLTAPDVAKVHFARELARLETVDSETMVVLHDACYGHRFSRPKTSKGALSMIVERPERLHAGVLGAATAFVRMGGHHEGQANAPKVEREVQDAPPFKIRRSARTFDVRSECVTNVHGTAWMGELKGMCDSAGDRLKNGEKELARESTTEGGEKRTLHEGDLYLCSESLNAFQGALGGVADAVDAIFDNTTQTKRAFVAVRPPGHHCSAEYPSGFCWLNNVHIGLEYAAQTHSLTHAAIIDFDLHHGDGSQSITWDRNSKNNIKRLTAKANSKLKLGPDIGYYSLHDINSYPCENGDDEKVQAASLCIENAHGQSIWNVHLQPWKTAEEFWQLYESRYKVLLEKARMFLRHHTARLQTEGKVQPRAAIFISAGFDASEWEGAGMQRHKVNVPTEFYARFTRDMVHLAQEDDTGCDGRVISVLEGGYSDRALCSGVLSHLSGLSRPSTSPAPVPAVNKSFDLEQHMLSLSLQNGTRGPTYDPQWWSDQNLTALENTVNPPPPVAPGGKKFRMGQQPTYATPTESFAYKVHDPERFARSISGTMRERPTSSLRAEPVLREPEIDWVVATQELAKLLIPQDRQTKSCTPEELAGPKKVAAAPTAAERDQAERPRQLRTRGAKPSYRENPDDVSRADRRRTTSDLPMPLDAAPVAVPAPVPAPAQARRSSRRSSMASTMGSTSTDAADDIPPVPAITTTTNGMHPPPMPAAAFGNMQMKKTRAPPKPKTTVIPASAPVSPVAAFKRQPPPQYRQAAPQPQPGTAQSPTPSSAVLRPDAMSPGSSDIDALTRGLKKVTLKLGSREEHDRKMKEKLDSERRARALKGAETRRINKAARDAEMSTAKLTPAMRAKLGPDAARTTEAKVAPTVQYAAPQGLAAAPLVQPRPAISNEMPRTSSAPVETPPKDREPLDIPPREESHTAATDAPSPQTKPVAQSVFPTAALPEAVTESIPETTPHFNIPTYSAPPPTTVPAPTTAPAPAPITLQSPTTNTFFNPSYAPQQPQQPPTHSRQSSSSPLYRFVPVMDKMETTPPSSRPSSSARAASFQPSPVNSLEKPSPPDRAASARDVADRPLPVFSATGRIPFAGDGGVTAVGSTAAGAAQVVGGGSRLRDEIDVDGREVLETPE
jgi:histone deacetylase HOS3